jgi:hypothetical protein
VILAPIKRHLSRKNTSPSQKSTFFPETSFSNGISPFSLPAPVIAAVIGARALRPIPRPDALQVFIIDEFCPQNIVCA